MIWQTSTPVILYGAAYFGTLINKYLKETSNIVAFLDKRADEIIQHKDIPVYLPENTPFDLEMKRNCIVILCVKNVFDHRSIAKLLLSQGFLHIITFENSIFNAITTGHLELPVEISPYQSLFKFKWKDEAIVKESADRLIANIPVPLIFTNKSVGEIRDKWEDWPIQALYPHLELFSYYNGNIAGDTSAYVDEYCVEGAKRVGNVKTSERWKKNILESRQTIFYNMDRHWQLKDSFFYDNAPTAEFHNGKFNLTSGKHRAMFLLAKGETFIPLNIEEKEYDCFLNMDKANLVMRYVEKMGIDKTFLSILHPYFYTFSSYSGFSLTLLLNWLMLYLGKAFFRKGKKISDLKVYSATRKYNAIARYFMQIGSNVNCFNYQDQLDILLDAMAGIINKNCVNFSGIYDIAIIELCDKSSGYKVMDIDSKAYLLILEEGFDLTPYFSSEAFRWEKIYQLFYGDTSYKFVFVEKVQK